MNLLKLPQTFAICKLRSIHQIDLTTPCLFLSKTEDEISLVCPAQSVPSDATHIEPDWKGLKIEGPLNFEMTGVIAKIAGILAARSISIFVVSTYDTDYIFLKTHSYGKAVTALEENGYEIVQTTKTEGDPP